MMATGGFCPDFALDLVVSRPFRGGMRHAVARRPSDANRADEELHLVRLPDEDMLDGGPDL